MNTIENVKPENTPTGTAASMPLFQSENERSISCGKPHSVSACVQAEPDPEEIEHTQIYEYFFKTMQHAAFIIDLNVNTQEAKAAIPNSQAAVLMSDCDNLFEDSRLEKQKGSLNSLIYTIRRKVAQQVTYQDTATIQIKSSAPKPVEKSYNVTAFTFEYGNDSRMLSLIMMEIPTSMKQEMEALDSFKESLMCSLSHELNTPMNSLIPLLKMMPSCPNVENGDDHKELALASAELLQSKIRDLIDYTKIEMKDFKMETSEFYVEDLFVELHRIFQYEVLHKKNRLDIKINTRGNKRLLILADKARIKQVLIKLIANANKFTNKGLVAVIASENRDNLNVSFAIRDTGAGMSKDSLGLIFASLPEKAKYIREHHNEFAKLPGLGLDIAKSICTQMNSKLMVTSQEGRGSCFSFEMPVCRIYSNISAQTIPEFVKDTQTLNFQLFHKTKDDSVYPGEKKEKPKKKRSSRMKLTQINSSEEKKITEKTKDTNLLEPPSKLLRCNSGIKLVKMRYSGKRNQFVEQKNREKMFHLMKTASAIPLGSTMRTLEEEEVCEEKTQVTDMMRLYGSFVRNNPVNSKIIHTNMVPRTLPSLVSILSPTACGTAIEQIVLKPRKNEVVLITDDQYSNRVVIREMLKKIKVQSIEAINGEEAVNKVEKSFSDDSAITIKLIFMDLNMPVKDGVQATVEIRKLERSYNRNGLIPIVAVTAHDTTNDQNACFEAGMQDYVLKPVDAITLHRLVSEYAALPATINIFTP